MDRQLANAVQAVREAAASAFPRSAAKQRKSWMSQHTWAMVRQRRSQLDVMCGFRR